MPRCPATARFGFRRSLLLTSNHESDAISRLSRNSVSQQTRCSWISPSRRALSEERAGRAVCCAGRVARIYVSRHEDRIRVRLTGPLRPADMGRLEHACAPALIRHLVALEIDIRGVRDMNRSALAVLHKMAERGARIIPGLPHIDAGSGA